MRKIFSKKVSTTTIQSAKVEFEEGVVKAIQNDPIVEVGKLDNQKAQELVTSTYGMGHLLTDMEVMEKTYKFNILDIIPYALEEDQE